MVAVCLASGEQEAVFLALTEEEVHTREGKFSIRNIT